LLIHGVSALKAGLCCQGDDASPMTPDQTPGGSGHAGEPVEVHAASHASSLARWDALDTRSPCKPLVADPLAANGFRVFRPTRETWSQRARRQPLVSLPMFPSDLFLPHAVDQPSDSEVRQARGRVCRLGER
jgi:hypothetical protein